MSDMFIDEERTKNLKFHKKDRRSTCAKIPEDMRTICGNIQLNNNPQGALLERQSFLQSNSQTSVSKKDRPKYQDRINKFINVKNAVEPVKIRRSENLPKSLPILNMGIRTAKKFDMVPSKPSISSNSNLSTSRSVPERKATQIESRKIKHDRIVDSSASCSGENSQTVRFQDEEMTESRKRKHDKIVDSSASCSGKNSQTVRFQDEEMTELEREIDKIVESTASCSRTMSFEDEEMVSHPGKKKWKVIDSDESEEEEVRYKIKYLFPLHYFCADAILKGKNPVKMKKLKMPGRPAVGKLHMKINCTKKNSAKIVSKLQNKLTKKRKRIVEQDEPSSDEEVIENDSQTARAPVLNSSDKVTIIKVMNKTPSNFKTAVSVSPVGRDRSHDLQVVEVKNELVNKIEFSERNKFSPDEELPAACENLEVIKNDSQTAGAPVLNDPVLNSSDEITIVEIINKTPSNFKTAVSVKPEDREWPDDDLQVIEVKKINKLIKKIELFYFVKQDRHSEGSDPLEGDFCKYVCNWHTHRRKNIIDSVLSSDIHHLLTPISR